MQLSPSLEKSKLLSSRLISN